AGGGFARPRKLKPQDGAEQLGEVHKRGGPLHYGPQPASSVDQNCESMLPVFMRKQGAVFISGLRRKVRYPYISVENGAGLFNVSADVCIALPVRQAKDYFDVIEDEKVPKDQRALKPCVVLAEDHVDQWPTARIDLRS